MNVVVAISVCLSGSERLRDLTSSGTAKTKVWNHISNPGQPVEGAQGCPLTCLLWRGDFPPETLWKDIFRVPSTVPGIRQTQQTEAITDKVMAVIMLCLWARNDKHSHFIDRLNKDSYLFVHINICAMSGSLPWWFTGKESTCQYRRCGFQEDSLEMEMATHSRILTWEIPWTEEPGGLQLMGHKELDTT